MALNQNETCFEQLNRASSVNFHLLPIQSFLEDESINEICINRPQALFVQRDGHWKQYDVPELTFEHLQSLSTAVAKFKNLDISDINPILSSTLPNDERIQIIQPPACEHGTLSITIRKFIKKLLRLEDFERQGLFAHVKPTDQGLNPDEKELLALKEKGDYVNFFRRAVQLRKNIAMVSDTGAGKTIFMKGLIEEIPAYERLITISDAKELHLPHHPNHVHLIYPSEASEEENAPITPSILLKSCLRMKPDRILLGEMRGAEAYDFIDMASGGHRGSITSFHADSCSLAFERLALMIMKNRQGRMLPFDVIKRLIYLVLDAVVHMQYDPHGQWGRHITEVWYDPLKKRSLMG